MLSEIMEVKDQNKGEVYAFLNNDTNLKETIGSASSWTSKRPIISERVSTVIKCSSGDGSTRSILQYFVSRVRGFLQVLGLDNEWKDTRGVDEMLKKESSPKFIPYYRLWSAFLFLYLDEDISEGTPSDLIAVDNESGETVRVLNEDEFGHGFVIGGSLLLHLMNQVEKFNLFDLSLILLSTSNYELDLNESTNTMKEMAVKPRRMTTFFGSGNKKADIDAALSEQKDPKILKKRDDFVMRGAFCKLVMVNTMNLLKTCSEHVHTSLSSTANGSGDENGVGNFLYPPTSIAEDHFI